MATQTPKKSNTSWYIAAIVIIIIIVVVGVVAYQASQPTTGPSPSPSASASPSPSTSASPSPSSSVGPTSVTIYSGETSSIYGFGNSAGSITSPGPALTFKAGQSVTVTLHNAPVMAHNWAIVNAKSSTATVLWNAQIGSASNPVSPGGTGSVTFTVGSAGTYYYICQVDAHVSLGMWGTVTVTP